MKKTICILLAFICLFAFSACGSLDAFQEDTTPSESMAESETAPADTVADLEITIVFDFGDRTGIYTGEMRDGLPDGQGTFSTQNVEGVGWVYNGGWRQGHMYGEGSTIFDTGYSEAGWYENDNLNGQGRQFQDERLTYEGEFVQNMPEGQGMLYSYCGDIIYAGSFTQGYINETDTARAERMSALRSQCDTPDYSELFERAQNKDGSYVQVTGTVIYMGSSDFSYECNFIIGSQDLSSADMIYVYYRLSEGETRVSEGQQVTVWAQISYLYSTESVDGLTLSMPFIEAWNVVDVSGTAM